MDEVRKELGRLLEHCPPTLGVALINMFNEQHRVNDAAEARAVAAEARAVAAMTQAFSVEPRAAAAEARAAAAEARAAVAEADARVVSAETAERVAKGRSEAYQSAVLNMLPHFKPGGVATAAAATEFATAAAATEFATAGTARPAAEAGEKRKAEEGADASHVSKK
jgi:colicin import membrane protein